MYVSETVGTIHLCGNLSLISDRGTLEALVICQTMDDDIDVRGRHFNTHKQSLFS